MRLRGCITTQQPLSVFIATSTITTNSPSLGNLVLLPFLGSFLMSLGWSHYELLHNRSFSARQCVCDWLAAAPCPRHRSCSVKITRAIKCQLPRNLKPSGIACGISVQQQTIASQSAHNKAVLHIRPMHGARDMFAWRELQELYMSGCGSRVESHKTSNVHNKISSKKGHLTTLSCIQTIQNGDVPSTLDLPG